MLVNLELECHLLQQTTTDSEKKSEASISKGDANKLRETCKHLPPVSTCSIFAKHIISRNIQL